MSAASRILLAHAGAYPRNGDSSEEQILRKTSEAFARGERTIADLLDAENVVTRLLIHEQVRAGVELLTDGCARWADPIAHVAGKYSGITLGRTRKLPWSDADRQLRARLALMRQLEPDAGWPDLTDTALEARLGDWLGPFLTGVARLDDLAAGPLHAALTAQLDHAQTRRLDAELPRELTVNGRTRALDYTADAPVLAVRLQDLFGQRDTPRLASGRVALVLHLLSPAGRPLAVTADLSGSWRSAYAEVRKQIGRASCRERV